MSVCQRNKHVWRQERDHRKLGPNPTQNALPAKTQDLKVLWYYQDTKASVGTGGSAWKPNPCGVENI